MIGYTLLTIPRPRTKMAWSFVSAPVGWTGGFIATWDEENCRGTIFISPAHYREIREKGLVNTMVAMALPAEEYGVVHRHPLSEPRLPTPVEVKRLCKFFDKRIPGIRDAAFVIYRLIPKDTPGHGEITQSFLGMIDSDTP